MNFYYYFMHATIRLRARLKLFSSILIQTSILLCGQGILFSTILHMYITYSLY